MELEIGGRRSDMMSDAGRAQKKKKIKTSGAEK